MGRRDFRRREPKKAKKGEQKPKPLSEFIPHSETEVIKRKRKPAEEYEE